MKRPNILFILSDQHRHFDMGWAGNAEVQTPVLDALASECARFSHAYSNCPVCVPARGSLYTGQHALRHGAAGNDIPIRRDQTGIAQVLSAAGYDTALIGKWHLGGVPRDQFIDKDRRLGFQYWRGNNCNHDYMKYYYDDNDDARHYPGQYEPVAQTALALEYLEGRKQSDDPWAMWMCYSTPHPPHLR
ncbi:MAG: sulfatase-like hydrolase/transferase, partial [Christensenellales bacterium]